MSNSVLIDAATIKSGGGLTHLRSFLSFADPSLHNFSSLVVLVDKSILSVLPQTPWIYYISPPRFIGGFLSLTLWRHFFLPRIYRRFSCSIALAFCGFTTTCLPCSVGVVQNLLPFDIFESRRYGLTLSRFRYYLLRFFISRFVSKSSGSIYLSRYSMDVVCRLFPSFYRQQHAIVHHAVDKSFFDSPRCTSSPLSKEEKLPVPLNFIYVSGFSPYKNHRFLLDSVRLLRDVSGLDIHVTLVGSNVQQLVSCCPDLSCLNWVSLFKSQDWEGLKNLYSKSDMFIWPSSCETFGIIQLEAMAAGLPIACSSIGPSKEICADAAVYFNPFDPHSFVSSVLPVLTPSSLLDLSSRSRARAASFAWEQSIQKTFDFLHSVSDVS